jgi:cbb3-type cytochrome oxidase subunit 3
MRRRVRKISKVNIKGVLFVLTIILLLCSFGVTFYMFKNARDDAEEASRETINELRDRLVSYTGTAYRAKEYIPAGTVLKPEMLEQYEIISNMPVYAAESDLGKSVLVDIKPGTEITKNLLATENVLVNLKEAEFDFIIIPANIGEHDYVDVRLRFPDGTDYIVASKKKVIHLDEQRKKVYMQMSEEEMLFLDSALTDTYRYGGSHIYLTKYISPEKVTASEVNYIPSVPLSKLIMDNPNIENIMTGTVSLEERLRLEDSLFSYLSGDVPAYESRTRTEGESGIEHGGSVWD